MTEQETIVRTPTEEMESRGWFAPCWFCIEVQDRHGWVYHGGVCLHERFATLDAARSALSTVRAEQPGESFRISEENGIIRFRTYEA